MYNPVYILFSDILLYDFEQYSEDIIHLKD